MNTQPPSRGAVLMTCHDRQAMTLRCVEHLMAQDNTGEVTFRVYLVDDGCTDGTAAAVREMFPAVVLLQGAGNLYWTGGMRLAFREAMKEDFDWYLLVNDDTFLFPTALRRLSDAWRALAARGKSAIIVGSTMDPVNGKCTFGGRVKSPWVPMAYRLVQPSDEALRCDTMNANCVLLDRQVARRVGELSPDYPHNLCDWEYGLRAGDLGVECWVAPGYVGQCSKTCEEGTWLDPRVPLIARYRLLTAPTGQPLGPWLRFARRFEGRRWPLAFGKWLALLLVPGLFRKLRPLQGSRREFA